MIRRALAAAVLATIGPAATAIAQPLHDPALRFHSFRTAHFVLYFHQGEETTAARLGRIAEDAWQQLAARVGPVPPPLTHVVLVDETELANGSAFPIPRDTIVVTAAWPAGSEYIGKTEDWLRLVFTHEFTHIVHLDRSGSWARIVRAVFGRVPLAFPNLFLPAWEIEGLATFEESALTGEGRLHAGDFQQITAEAARARALEPLDRVNGGLTDWPNGLAAYAYGLGFHAYLADTYGEAKFRDLADRTARRVPYLGSPAFRQVYGKPLDALWAEYQQWQTAAARLPAGEAPFAERLTHHGFYVSGPRFTPDGLVYSVRTPHELPALYILTPAGPARLATRYLGSTAGVSGRTIVFDQQELRRNAGLYSDLYTLDLRTRAVRAITRDARLLDPDLSADGMRLAAVRQTAGRRELVVFDAAAPLSDEPGRLRPLRVLASAPDTQFNSPRWAPDGRRLAVERHRPGELSDVVILDARTGDVDAVVTRPDTRVVTPTWTRDGRTVIAAAAIGNASFQLVAVDVPSRNWRTITNVAGGALWPELSPDGRSIVYVGYTVDGFDLFRLRYEDARAPSGVDAANASAPIADRESVRPTGVEPQRLTAAYTPWPTFAPTWWSPIVTGDRRAWRVGAATGGNDVLGYHAYAVSATWLVTSPQGAPLDSRTKPDWQIVYAYLRWRPALYLSATSDTTFFAGPATDSGAPSQATLRERELAATVVVPFVHIRASHTAIASFVTADDEFALPEGSASLRRAAVRAAWATRTAHVFGYSISPERGATLAGTIESVDSALGASADARAATIDARGYLPGVGDHHVVALRGAAGTSSGDASLRRTFLLGGPGPNADPVDFGSGAISLLRGFPVDTFAGRNVVLANADYRLPIARIERGIGTWPLFLHTVHAAAFGDAGHAWTRTFRLRDLKTAVGAELAADIVVGYNLPLTIAAGAAYGRDGSGRVAGGTSAYVRIGRAF